MPADRQLNPGGMDMDNEPFFSVLVVDDDSSDLSILNRILKSDYTVYFAKSGRAALKRAKENKPDIILLDVIMPDMNGFEVLEELKNSDATRHIPVIFITGLDGVKDEEKGFRLGAVDYITKPFHSAIVKARIKAHLKTAEQLRDKDSAAVMVKTRQEMRNVFFREILYVNVTGHWLNFHLADGETIEVYASLKEYDNILLSDGRFAHCHKSFMVNMDFVDVVELREAVLKNGDRLPISKGYLDFKKQYVQWVGE